MWLGTKEIRNEDSDIANFPWHIDLFFNQISLKLLTDYFSSYDT